MLAMLSQRMRSRRRRASGVEMFAREHPGDGWEVWGNEASGSDPASW
jgi:N6-adenosine-specific RNA methylase IME4